MGSVYKRGRSYYVDIRSDGKRIRRKVGPSKHLAELALKDLEVKIAKKRFDFETADGFISDLFDAYLEYGEGQSYCDCVIKNWLARGCQGKSRFG